MGRGHPEGGEHRDQRGRQRDPSDHKDETGHTDDHDPGHDVVDDLDHGLNRHYESQRRAGVRRRQPEDAYGKESEAQPPRDPFASQRAAESGVRKGADLVGVERLLLCERRSHAIERVPPAGEGLVRAFECLGYQLRYLGVDLLERAL